jgi:hypothetical protein
MDTLLWALQMILCVKLISVAYSHGLRRGQPSLQQAIRKLGGPAEPLLTFATVATLVSAAALVLPAVSTSLNCLAPVAAAMTALLMLLSVGFHVFARQTPNILVGVVLFAMAAFTAYGRWVLAPLGT